MPRSLSVGNYTQILPPSCSLKSIMCFTVLQKPALNYCLFLGFPGGSDGKESACSSGYPGSIPGLGGSPEEGNVYPLQYSCLENSMDRGAWQAPVHGVTKSQTRLSDWHFHFFSLFYYNNNHNSAWLRDTGQESLCIKIGSFTPKSVQSFCVIHQVLGWALQTEQ